MSNKRKVKIAEHIGGVATTLISVPGYIASKVLELPDVCHCRDHSPDDHIVAWNIHTDELGLWLADPICGEHVKVVGAGRPDMNVVPYATWQTEAADFGDNHED